MDLQLLADRAAIGDLINRYALNVRRKDAAACADLFAPEIVFEVRQREMGEGSDAPVVRSHVEGIDKVRDYVARSAAGGLSVCPIVHNILIEVDGDVARSNCVMASRTWPTGSEVIGEYDDTFRRTSHGWRFASRAFTIFA